MGGEYDNYPRQGGDRQLFGRRRTWLRHLVIVALIIGAALLAVRMLH